MARRALLPSTGPQDMAKSREWAGRFLSGPAELPVSFMLGGKPAAGISADWQPRSRRRRLDAGIVETVLDGSHVQTGLNLRVECLAYPDYPVVEWVAWFTNTGSRPTPIISDILALDARFAGSSPVLQHSNGDFCSGEGYALQKPPVRAGRSLTFVPAGGRPCGHAFPYYRVMFEGCGLSIAIGWPAQWSATFTGVPGGVHVKAGQEKTHLRLTPGETIRTPLINTPEIRLDRPIGAGFTEKAIYVSDMYNFRVVRADMTWKAEETCEIK